MKRILIYYAKGVGSTNKAKIYQDACEELDIDYVTVTDGKQHSYADEVMIPDYIIGVDDVNGLRNICINEKIDIILPCNELLIDTSAIVSEELGLSDHLSIYHSKLFVDKSLLYTEIAKAGLNTFKMWNFNSIEDLKNIDFDGRILVKLKNGSNSAKRCMVYESVSELLNREEAEHFVRCNNDLDYASQYLGKPKHDIGGVFICEYVKPKGIHCTQLVYHRGKLFNKPYSRMRTLDWPEIGNSGFFSYFDNRRDVEEKLNNHLVEVFKALNVDNIFLLPELVLDENDNVYLMDANPRLGGENVALTWKKLGCDIMKEYLKFLQDKTYEPDFSYYNDECRYLYFNNIFPEGKFEKVLPKYDNMDIYDNYKELDKGMISKNTDINIHLIGNDEKQLEDQMDEIKRIITA